MGFPAALFLVLALLLGACSGPGGNHPPQIAAFPLRSSSHTLVACFLRNLLPGPPCWLGPAWGGIRRA